MKTSDGSIVDSEGKALFFSLERFVRDIGEGDCCFICGRSPLNVEFNDEHVLPDWILREYDLIGKSIHLPNGTEFQYDRYKVPCCVDCNSLMGRTFEEPISRIIKGGFAALEKHIREEGPMMLYKWINLIFLKTHLKDKNLRFNLDRRKPADPISDLYDWSTLHHIHAVARSFYTGARLEKEVFGSFLVWPVRRDLMLEEFDYVDLYLPKTVALRLGTVGFLTVLNDSCATSSIMAPRLERLGGELSGIQLRELLCEMAFVNLHLRDRPTFRTEFARNECRIAAEHPATCELTNLDKKVRGTLMASVLAPLLPSIEFVNRDRDQFLRALREGDASFIFDDNGKFISEPPKPLS